MKTKTEKILSVLKILAWLAMIGYSMECGSQVISFIVSFKNPDLAKHFYAVHQDLFSLRQHNVWFFIYAMSLLIVLSAMKVLLWWLVIQLLFKLRLQTPFSIEIARKLEKIAYQLFVIWVISIIGMLYTDWLTKITGEQLSRIGVADEFFFISGIVYIISQIFRRGIEMQEENQLTV